MHAASLPRAALKGALASVLPAVQRRSTIPILTYVRLATLDGAVVITGTDLDREVSAIFSAAKYGDGDICIIMPKRV